MCGLLSAEVRVQSGERFHIFQDRNDIQWGQNWKERIEQSIDAVTFLIPIVTPSFFKSPACREELERFLKREQHLVLPVYYVGCSVLDDEEKRATDPLAGEIASHQFSDWRDLRFEPFTSPDVRRALARMAINVRDALDRKTARTEAPAEIRGGGSPSHPIGTSTELQSGPQAGETATAESPVKDSGPASGPTAKTEPPTRVVDPLHRGDHATIAEAIKRARPGDRIRVRPGVYKEGLVIDKPLEIVGDGSLEEIIVEAEGADAVLFKTTMGRLVNLTLRQAGGGEWFGVDIAQGRLELEACDISSESLACVAIHGGAAPSLKRNRIHDGKQSGVYVYENGQGILEDNDISGNGLAGVSIKTGGNPTLRRNRIHDGKESGVHVYKNGQGFLEDNDISGNGLAGVAIQTGGNPTLRRNRIHDGKGGGVYVYEEGQGVLEDNDISGRQCQSRGDDQDRG